MQAVSGSEGLRRIPTWICSGEAARPQPPLGSVEMLKKLINLMILVPLGIVLIVLSVANRQSVTLALNPFLPDDRLLSLTAPFFVFLFAALILGFVIGAVGMWIAQGKYRKRARTEAKTAVKWQAEADRHKTQAEQLAGRPLAGLPSK